MVWAEWTHFFGKKTHFVDWATIRLCSDLLKQGATIPQL
ncbi:hypothetical protein FRUB_08354 [Fimbriiglobus ruber]|uniref:Uncharacterized protein n=1 Tax=Fimbriiglobus ruber TaxID=1908690 RepID=A0A225D2H4_9BACT|nr:hypothetical protein FRUB_08354 [Fimbriiglobus ruber]